MKVDLHEAAVHLRFSTTGAAPWQQGAERHRWHVLVLAPLALYTLLQTAEDPAAHAPADALVERARLRIYGSNVDGLG